MNRSARRMMLTMCGVAGCGVVALAGGCGTSPARTEQPAVSQLLPGPTLAVSDSMGAQIYGGAKAMAARQAASARALASGDHRND